LGQFGERLSNDAACEAADEFEGAPVDDVRGPVLEVVEGWGVDWGRSELESRDGEFVGTKEEKVAIRGAGSGGDLGEDFCGDAVDYAHESAKGVVDDLAGCLLLVGSEGFAGSFRDFAGDFFSRVFLKGGLLLLVGLFVGYLPFGFSLG
jgi:hypothetical protein